MTGGQAAGDASIPPALSLFDAVTRGAKCPRTNTGKESSGDKFYLVDKERKQVLAGPDESRADLQKEALNKKIPFDAKQVVKVPAGRRDRPRRAARSQGQAAAGLVRAQGPADPRRHGHQEPRAGLRQRPGRERPAQRHLRLHQPRRRTCGRSSRASSPSAARSSRSALRATPSNQHFAITLDNELISVPQIDWHQYPDGLGGGQRVADLGRLHHRVRPAAGQPAEDRRPADQARAHLGLAGLGHAGQAGAATRASIAGVGRLHHRRPLPADLLPRAGRHRGRRPASSTRSSSTR